MKKVCTILVLLLSCTYNRYRYLFSTLPALLKVQYVPYRSYRLYILSFLLYHVHICTYWKVFFWTKRQRAKGKYSMYRTSYTDCTYFLFYFTMYIYVRTGWCSFGLRDKGRRDKKKDENMQLKVQRTRRRSKQHVAKLLSVVQCKI